MNYFGVAMRLLKIIRISVLSLCFYTLFSGSIFAAQCKLLNQECLETLFLEKSSTKSYTFNPFTRKNDVEYVVLRGQPGEITLRKYLFQGKNVYVLSTGSFKNNNLRIIIIDRDIPNNYIAEAKNFGSVQKVYASQNDYKSFIKTIPNLVFVPTVNISGNIGIMFDENPENSSKNIAEQFDVYIGTSALLGRLINFNIPSELYSAALLEPLSKARQLVAHFENFDIFLRISGHGNVDATHIADNQNRSRNIDTYPVMLKDLLGNNDFSKKILFELDTCLAGSVEISSNSSTLARIMKAFKAEFKRAHISGRASPFSVNYSNQTSAIKRFIWNVDANSSPLSVVATDILTAFAGYVYANVDSQGNVTYALSNSQGQKVSGYPNIVFDLVQKRTNLILDIDRLETALKQPNNFTRSILLDKIYRNIPLNALETNYLKVIAINNTLKKYENKLVTQGDLVSLLLNINAMPFIPGKLVLYVQ